MMKFTSTFRNLLMVVSALLIGTCFYSCKHEENQNTEKEIVNITAQNYKEFLENHPFRKTMKMSKQERQKIGLPPNKFYEQEWLYTSDPSLLRPAPERVHQLQKLIAENPQMRTPPGSATNSWVERGPNNVGGRTHTLMFAPGSTTRVFAGGVSGGLWVNNDITSAASVWQQVNGVPGNMAVMCMTVDPNDTNTMYIGTGEVYTWGAVNGNGVYKSTDGGANWTLIYSGGTSIADKITYVQDIIAWNNPSTNQTEVFFGVDAMAYTEEVSTNSGGAGWNWLGSNTIGLYRSTDGTNFTRLTGSLYESSAGNYYAPNDFDIDAAGNLWMGTKYSYFTGEGGGRIFRNNGSGWTNVRDLGTNGRVELACSGQNANTIYVLAEDRVNTANPAKIYRTTNAFATAPSLRAYPNDADTGIPANDFTRGQSFYDLMIGVDPNNDAVVYVGGIDLFKSTNSGSSWSQFSHWYGGFGYQEVHADQHGIAFANSNRIVFSNDGGVYYTNNGGTNTFARNNGYNVTQFYKGAINQQTSSDKLLAGAQDNGSQLINNAPAGIGSSTEVTGGDGCWVFIDQDNQYMVSSYVYNNYYRLSYATGAQQSTIASNSNDGDFVNQCGLDSNSNLLFANGTNGTTYRIYRYNNITGTATRTTLTNGMLDAIPTAFVASPYTNNRVLVGTALGKIIRLNNANATPTWTDISMPGAIGAVSDIRYGASENDIMVTFHNYGVNSVWYTADGGSNWVSKEGDLPDMPVKCILQNPLSPNEVIVGTELGVWQTSNWSDPSPNWTQSQNGMSDVKVLSFDFRSADNTILAATFGRGMFTGTFEVAASDPEISFDTTSGTTSEGSECNFTDFDVNLTIALGASADADVNFSVNGSSTATDGVDFELMTPSVTFPAGATTSQTMTLRVYEDAILEGDETVIIDFTVNANGGNAIANTSADTFTLTINNDDNAPSSASSTTLFSEDFESGPYNVTTSSNSTTPWAVGNTASASSTYWNTTGNSTNFAFTNDDACNCDKSNDRLTTNVINMAGPYSTATLSFDHAFADVIAAEAGTVRISTDGTAYTTLQTLSNTSINNGSGSFTTPWVNSVSVDISSYIGQPTVYIQFLYNDGNDWSYGMAVDNILVTASGNTGVQTAVNTGTPDQININQLGTAYAQDPGTNDLMAGVINNNSFDYGCVDVTVSRAGTGAQAYNGSVLPDLVTDKTFSISPSNTTSSGNTSLRFYFEEAEIAGWETATGLDRNTDLVVGREVGGIISETSSVTLGAFGSNVTVQGTFTGLEGTYYFGSADAFVGCSGAVKTWNGSSWSPPGAPDTTNPVILVGNYSTLIHGNLEACTLIVNGGATLTVGAGSYTLVDGNISVDGSLMVEHQGSVVQVDNDAVVTNNGTIHVGVTSPNLASRDFMVMGSPMSSETRNGVWNSAFLVLDHDTNNFVPNPAVAAAFPLAENFADDNYDNWNPYTGGINAGEGYIVRPQAGYGQPGGVFSFTFQQGTLNNGVVNFNVIYNTPGTPSENKNASPNIVANPYASAISATDFINANAMVDELYFWEHNTPPSPGMPGAGAMNFSMEDISMRNLFGGTAAASGGTDPTEFISTGQGFGFKANAAGTAVFNNSMRRTGNNDTFRNSLEADRIWLKVSEPTYEMGNTTLVGFSEATSEGEDPGYDSRRLATVVSLYSHLQDGTKEFGIQALGAFQSSAKIPMGFSTLVDAELEYTISIENIEGANLETATVYLMDNQLGILTDLTAEDYLFRSGKGTYQGRFTLLFERSPLGVAEFNGNSVSMYPNPTDGQLTIVSKQARVESITVFDLQGRKVLTYEGDTSVVHMNMSHLNASVYFVEVKTTEGTVNKRIIKK